MNPNADVAAGAGRPETLAEIAQRIASGPLAVEALLAIILIALAFTAPRLGGRFYDRLEARTLALAGGPVRQILLVGLLALLARAALLPWMGAPAAAIHDEQSLVLQAQTYLAGRLANPTHPFWEHFETFHVNQVPAYASMYFPGRSAPLAVGLLLADQAWVGVWLCFVLLCMAAVWMLQGWVPGPYALLGGLFIVLRFGVFSYWVNSYWGGAFTALGGMLVIGVLPRILKRPSWSLGAVFGLGAAILMTTRTYEGFLLCLPPTLLLLWRLLRPTWNGGRWALLKPAVPAALLVGAGGALLLAYNAATTGHALKAPYEVNRATYANAPAFLISPPLQSQQRGPAYFRVFYAEEAQDYLRRSGPVKLVASVAGKVFHNWNFYVGPVFTFALLAGLWAVRREYFVVGALAFFALGYMLETWNFPHYTAPAMSLLLIVMMRGFMWLRGWQWRGQPSGLFLTRAMPTAGLLFLLLPLSATVWGVPRIQANSFNQACCTLPHDDLRSRVMDQLRATPGRDLVLVKDGPNNPVHYEMVYNEPDIDRAEIVIARRLSPERDAALVRHFAGRQVWEFEWRPDLPDGHTLRPLEPGTGMMDAGH